MFDSITLADHNSAPDKTLLDIGSLVESMLLYGKVTVVANFSILDQIYSYFGGDNLHWILNEGYLNVTYREYPGGIHTEKKENSEVHNVIQFSSPQHRFEDDLRKLCIDARGKKGAGRRLARRLEGCIRVSREIPMVLVGARESILNSRYMTSSAKIVINELVPDFSLDKNYKFEAYQSDFGIVIETNLDFASINKRYYNGIVPLHPLITPAYILSHILRLEEALFFSASYSSDLSCNSLVARLGINKVDYIVDRSLKKSCQLNSFKEAVFGNVGAIREAVNSGSVCVDDLLSVLRKSRQYKEWILGAPPDADLLQEYLKKIGEKSFLEKLPGKIIRYSIFGGLGFAASNYLPSAESAGISLSLGILDTFFLDKLMRGWNPHHYIVGEVGRLINR